MKIRHLEKGKKPYKTGEKFIVTKLACNMSPTSLLEVGDILQAVDADDDGDIIFSVNGSGVRRYLQGDVKVRRI